MKNIEIFNRIEQKYLLDENEYKTLLKSINKHVEKDEYFKSNILNIYFDTSNNDLIINSLDKGPYKEKVRLRSYNIPSINDKVFLEIKSKYNGIVYKRRIKITLNDFYNYLNGKSYNSSNKQIMSEIDYLFKKYKLIPSYFIAYDRTSYYDSSNTNFRITFDENIRYRKDNLILECDSNNTLYFKDKKYIMELKSIGSIPMWFTNILSELKIYPTSFSKYGSIYEKHLKEEINYV